jgi:hypothetical protein
MSTEIIEARPQEAVPAETFNVEGLIAKAIEKKVPVDTMERILAMRRELLAEQAKRAFDQALAGFQAECPTIEKTKKVFDRNSTKIRYQYAPIEAIIEQVKPLLQRHGFSYTIKTKTEDNRVTAIVKATHEQGHSELSDFTIPIDPQGFMNEQQKFASALTFAKRYAFCNAFGIMTGDEDDDANSNGEPTTKQNARPAPAKPAPLSAITMDFLKALEAAETEAGYNEVYSAINEAKANQAITQAELKVIVAAAKQTVERVQSKPKPAPEPMVVEPEVIEPKEESDFAKAVKTTKGAKFVH